MGREQDNQAGLGWGEPGQFWSKATREQQEIMVAEMVTTVKQECYLIKAVSQAKQGAWTRWEDTTSRLISKGRRLVHTTSAAQLPDEGSV